MQSRVVVSLLGRGDQTLGARFSPQPRFDLVGVVRLHVPEKSAKLVVWDVPRRAEPLLFPCGCHLVYVLYWRKRMGRGTGYYMVELSCVLLYVLVQEVRKRKLSSLLYTQLNVLLRS